MSLDSSVKFLCKKLRENSTEKYKFFLILFFVFMILFGSSKLWLPSDVKIMNTAIGTTINTSANTSLKLRSWEYSRANQYMEIAFDVIDQDDRQELNFSPVAHTNVNKATDLQISSVLSQDGTLVIQIKDVPASWDVISLWIQDNTNSEVNSTDALQGANFYCDNRKVHINNSLKPKTNLEYQIQSIENQITDVKAQIKGLDMQIKNENAEIYQLNFDITALKNNQKYQTKEEIGNSNSVINNKLSQIDDHKNNITKYQNQIAEYNIKLQKLNQKKADTASGKISTSSATPTNSSSEQQKSTGENVTVD